MHMLAKRILKEQVVPQVEMLLGDKGGKGLHEVELRQAYTMSCLAKELLECDVMLKKLGESDPETPRTTGYPSASPMNL